LNTSGDRVSRDTFSRSSPAARSGSRQPGQADAVGGQRDLGPRPQRRHPRHQPGKSRAQQRLAAGEPDLGDAQAGDRDPDQPDDLVVGEQQGPGQPVQPLSRHAVGAPQVAPVSQRDPQVRGHAPERVGQHHGTSDPGLMVPSLPALGSRMTEVTVTVDGVKYAITSSRGCCSCTTCREVVGKTGTPIGCDTSNCGACTVLMDGESVKSCAVLAVQADGADITTIEGMANGGLHPLQQAFHESTPCSAGTARRG
jgi:hypothetical protein